MNREYLGNLQSSFSMPQIPDVSTPMGMGKAAYDLSARFGKNPIENAIAPARATYAAAQDLQDDDKLALGGATAKWAVGKGKSFVNKALSSVRRAAPNSAFVAKHGKFSGRKPSTRVASASGNIGRFNRVIDRGNGYFEKIADRKKPKFTAPNRYGKFGTALGVTGIMANKAFKRFEKGFNQSYHGEYDSPTLQSAFSPAGKFREVEEPRSTPNTKKRAEYVVPSTSVTTDPKSVPEAAKTKPTGGTHKAPKPETSVGPKKAKKGDKPGDKVGAKAADQEQTITPEQQTQLRAGEIRQRLAGISMIKSPLPKPAGASMQKPAARESDPFIVGDKKIRRGARENTVAKVLKSKASPHLRSGTGIKHTFISDDKQHLYSGRALSMRQKIISEHKRKNFPLPENFSNIAPEKIGATFDSLSDRGMLEDRPSLDDSTLRRWGRMGKRVFGRTKRNIVGMFKNVAQKVTSFRKKESEETAPAELLECGFELGQIETPQDCSCSKCQELLEMSSTSVGQMTRAGVKAPNLHGIVPEETPNLLQDLLQPKEKKSNVVKKIIAATVKNNVSSRENLHVNRKRRDKKRGKESDVVKGGLMEAYDMSRDFLLHEHEKRHGARSYFKRGFFNTNNLLFKMDRLGHAVATVAALKHGLNTKASAGLWKGIRDIEVAMGRRR